jgi:hypothetical protein
MDLRQALHFLHHPTPECSLARWRTAAIPPGSG